MPLFLCSSSLQVQEDSGDAFPGRTEDDRGSEYNEHGPQQEDRRHEVQCDRANMATAPAQLQEQMSAGTCGPILTPSPARQPGDESVDRLNQVVCWVCTPLLLWV